MYFYQSNSFQWEWCYDVFLTERKLLFFREDFINFINVIFTPEMLFYARNCWLLWKNCFVSFIQKKVMVKKCKLKKKHFCKEILRQHSPFLKKKHWKLFLPIFIIVSILIMIQHKLCPVKLTSNSIYIFWKSLRLLTLNFILRNKYKFYFNVYFAKTNNFAFAFREILRNPSLHHPALFSGPHMFCA